MNTSQDRRRRRRYTVGLPVRLYFDGHEEPVLAELENASATGCYLKSEEMSRSVRHDLDLAFGFVLEAEDLEEVGLVRGHVVRAIPGDGFGVEIDQANATFDEFLGRLAHLERHAA